MNDWSGSPMDPDEIDAFLAARGTGVLSLGKDDDGYGFPVSYSYTDDEDAVYLRLGFGPESQKRAYVDAAERVSLVVYDDTEAGWKSVVVEGSLGRVSPGRLESSLAEDVRGFHIPTFAVFSQPADELDFEVYRLAADTITGIAEAR